MSWQVVLSVLFLTLTATTGQQPNCPSGWVPSSLPNDKRCFYVSYPGGPTTDPNDPPPVTDWFSAEKLCQDQAQKAANGIGHLVSIKNSFERAAINDLVQSYLTSQNQTASQYSPYWIGAYDYMTPGVYQWTDASTFDSSSAPWYPGQPSPAGDCIQSELGTGHDQWVAVKCSFFNPFVCQSVPRNASCRANWTFNDEKNLCFGVFKKTLDQEAAEATCGLQGENGHLATIDSPTLNQVILNVAADPALPRCNDDASITDGWFWIGLVLDGTNPTPDGWKYTWMNDLNTYPTPTPANPTPLFDSYLNFAVGSPPAVGTATNIPTNKKLCTRFSTTICRTGNDNVLRGQWRTEACTADPDDETATLKFNSNGFICQMPPPTSKLIPPPPELLH